MPDYMDLVRAIRQFLQPVQGARQLALTGTVPTGTAPNADYMSAALQLFSPSNLVNAPYQFRYGMNAPEKLALANSGIPLGVSPQQAESMPREADRAAAMYAGTNKWGNYLPQLFNEWRNTFGIARLQGETPDIQDVLRNTAILAQSRAIADRQTPKQAPYYMVPNTYSQAAGPQPYWRK